MTFFFMWHPETGQYTVAPRSMQPDLEFMAGNVLTPKQSAKRRKRQKQEEDLIFALIAGEEDDEDSD